MAYFTVRTGCLRRLPKKGVKNLPEEIDWEEKIVYGDDAETRKTLIRVFFGWIVMIAWKGP